VVSLVSWW